MKMMRRRIAAILAVAIAFAMPLPVVAAPESAATVVPTALTSTAVTTADLKCVTMVSDTLAFAAGASGTIIKTTDGGDNWVKLVDSDLAVTDDFRGIAFWDANNGVAVTYNRKVVGTSDGGVTWESRNADMTYYALGSPPIGVSGVTKIPGSSTSAILFGGTKPNDGLQLQEQAWQTGNSGQYWGNSPVLAPTVHVFDDGLGNTYPVGDGEFLGMDFFDASRGWVVGDDMYPNEDTSTVYATTNGGTSWSRQTFPAALRLTGVAFGSSTNGVIVSSVGRVFRTTNGGTSWGEGTSPVTSSINGVDMANSTAGWAAGATGRLLRTTDGGSTWSLGTSPTSQDLAAIALSGTRGIAVGKFGTIVVTTDSTTWRMPIPDTTGPTMTSLTSATHPDEAGWYKSASATFSWSATDSAGVSGYSYVRDTSPSTRPAATNLGSATTTSVTVPEGVSYFHVIALDSFGNSSATPLHRTVRVDLTAPSTTDSHVSLYETGTADITLTPDDALSGVAKTEWTDNNGAVQTGTHVVVVGDGAHTLRYASTDAAGNKEATQTATFDITSPPVDTEAPVFSSLVATPQADPATYYKSTSATVSWSASDPSGVAGYAFALDSALSTASPVTSTSTSLSALTDGPHTFRIRAVDTVGNWTSEQTLTIKTDSSTPTSTVTVSPQVGEDATVTISATDAYSGVARIEWAIDGVPAGSAAASPAAVHLSGVATYTITYSATDLAGNREATKTVPVVIVRPDTQYVPVEGSNRYATAAAASQLAFPSGAPAVVIATGANWPDALGGAALAGAVGGPILLTDPKTLPSAIHDEIVRLGATHAYVLGSEAAVSKPVYDAVDAIPGVVVERVAGANRYATANAIAVKTTDLLNGTYDGTMFVATGLNFPDALAASPLSAANGWPLYLAAPTGLSDATLATMQARGSRVIILGSASAVPVLVENQLKTAFPGAVERVYGGDRYGTGIAIANYGVSNAGLNWRVPALATGTNFPDALAGGVLQGLDGSVLLLTNGTVLTPAVGDTLGAHKADIREVRYLGSVSAVSAAVRTAVQSIVQ
ncbi:MAG: hypothetical protein CVT59_05210 [Actinobacteria bacterium HGW-Actinobacteria-1]|jgi:photosystem II stability/assembly factor-like uncharacterized protein/putative cell wall-binding protein|nr:MAG: hypothetical protein CVT59_05210 [Actinobacteria bacterium HGW-Actinobacteria-1]